ncbi:MAG: sugar kinase [Firmicutes bacterium HGW-Firmicutes-7]|nr:MAG: sugar kinase [Firmicutes bacterium HGW-Firmicutes-7]
MKMKYVASFDIGTTATKGLLVSIDKQVICSKSIAYKTIYKGDKKEQEPEDWYRAFCEISKTFFERGYLAQDIIGIVMSGQMQDLICVDHLGQPLGPAILYSDARAIHEAKEITKSIGEDVLYTSTGNKLDGSIPFAKLLWVMRNEPSKYNEIYKILISSKDYCVSKLTDQYITDMTSAATSGLMDIQAKTWNKIWMKNMDLDPQILPELKYSQECVGEVTKRASIETGYNEGTKVYAGTGDAGATTLASGIANAGEYNINIGTSGWIAGISKDVLLKENVFNLAAMQKDFFINVIPFLNAGGVHKWITSVLAPEDQSDPYAYINLLLNESESGSHDLMFLPYLSGERFPVLDDKAKGCYIGITPETTKNDMVRACLEAVAFSIRQGLEVIGGKVDKITLIGGGAKVQLWCQIFADVFAKTIYVSEDTEFMPSIAITAAVFINQGLEKDYSSFIDSFLSSNSFTLYHPVQGDAERLNKKYKKYIEIYPAVKNLF